MDEKTIKTEKAEKAVKKTPKFAKDALLKSKRFRDRRDALTFLLEDGREYTAPEVEKILNDYYTKGEVR
jgi:hypothetical protein